MAHLNVLITGGCGFIGSSLAVALAGRGHTVTVFDNLARRGSELLLRRVLACGCAFQHGDIRNPEDLHRLRAPFEVMLECSAEPSVLVGTQGADARFMIRNNLEGAANCFEVARERGAAVLFLSTSRVYPYTTINACEFREGPTRFELACEAPGITRQGVATSFPLSGARSLYGATKLAAELLLQEYSAQYGVPAIINRCGVVAGPWQLGKVDQGVFTYWLVSHYFNKPLAYIGFGGSGKQVRDLLHVDDLAELVAAQIAAIGRFRGEVFNVGGSAEVSLSLAEATELCRQITGRRLEIGRVPENRPADVIWYITDNGNTAEVFQWRPRRGAAQILTDTFNWLREHEAEFREVFGA